MIEIFMPKAGMDMKEGRLIRWLKNVGDPVELDEPIMEIETDKITMEAESPGTGILLAKLIEDDTTVPVLQTIGWIGQPGEKVPSAEGSAASAEAVPASAAAAPASGAGAAVPQDAAPASAEAVSSSAALADGFILATPYARRVAQEKNIPLANIPADGPITSDDVLRYAVQAARKAAAAPAPIPASDVAVAPAAAPAPATAPTATSAQAPIPAAAPAYVPAAAPPPIPAQGEPIRIPLTQIRKAIARNMYQSLQEMAQTSNSVEIDVTELLYVKKELARFTEQTGLKVSLNDLFSYAAVRMIGKHPFANACYTDDAILQYPYVNLCTAVATDYGLVSPVVHNADKMTFFELSRALHDKVERARAKKLTADDLAGGTFTLTNLGIFPVDTFTPILPLYQSCIVGFGRCTEKPAVYNGAICIRSLMTLSVTYDHRVFDGAEIGRILKTLKEYLENPYRFLIE